VPWNFDEWGFPTVVSPLFPIQQGTKANGEKKWCVIMDLRYANGCIDNDSPDLPAVVSIARQVRHNDVTSKQDMKAGDHQVPMAKSCWHLAAIEWRGRIYCYTCATFGFRDAPGQFQRRTSHVARAIKNELKLRVSEVYLDDSVQSDKHIDIDAVIAIQLRHGLVLSREKRADPRTKTEVLGLEIDTEKIKILVCQKKSSNIAN